MIIVKIQDLERVGNSEYARICQSNEVTYLNETDYEINLVTNVDDSDFRYFCKGWDCPVPGGAIALGKSGNSKCGVSVHWGNLAHLIRLEYYSNTLLYDTPCKNYENAYKVNEPGQAGYVIGCPNGLELYDELDISSTSEDTRQSSEQTDLSNTSKQFGVGIIVGIVFASIAGVTILAVGIGIVGFFILNLASKKGLAEEYSVTKHNKS